MVIVCANSRYFISDMNASALWRLRLFCEVYSPNHQQNTRATVQIGPTRIHINHKYKTLHRIQRNMIHTLFKTLVQTVYCILYTVLY